MTPAFCCGVTTRSVLTAFTPSTWRAAAISIALSARDFTVPLRCTTFSLVETLTFVPLSPGSLEIAVLTRLVIAASLEGLVQPELVGHSVK